MKEIISHFFGCFFSYSSAKRNENKTPANAIISMVCALLLISVSLSFGRNISFRSFYADASELRNFALSALGDGGIKLLIEDGKIKNDITVNSFENPEDAKYKENGYDIIVDSRSTDDLYDDFTMLCRSFEDGLGEITYEEYLSLHEEQKSKYTSFRIKYSGRAIDTSEKHSEYISYLEKVSDTESSLYNEDIAKTYSELEPGSESYCDDIYELFVLAYYKTADNAESASAAPTISGYYIDIMSHDTDGKYIVLLSEICYVSFTSRGVDGIFLGNYDNTPNANSFQSEADIDEFLIGIFASTENLNHYIFFLKTFDFAPLLAVLLTLAVMSFILLKLHRKAHPRSKRTFGECMQIVASFGIVSGIVASACAFIMSFLVSQLTIFYFAFAVFLLMMIIRTVLFIFSDVNDEEYNVPPAPVRSYHTCDDEEDGQEEHSSFSEDAEDE